MHLRYFSQMRYSLFPKPIFEKLVNEFNQVYGRVYDQQEFVHDFTPAQLVLLKNRALITCTDGLAGRGCRVRDAVPGCREILQLKRSSSYTPPGGV